MTSFITRSGPDGHEIIVETDNREHYEYIQKAARFCIDHMKPQTNADRIRKLSDEELAAFLYRFVDIDDEVHFCENRRECQENVENIRQESCVECLVRWLKKPAEDGDGNGN